MAIPGSNIRLLRQQMGLSLKALAAAADIDYGNLSKLENGSIGYSKEVLERIARKLSVSVGVLFAEPAAVEAAALRKRNVPLLTPELLGKWRGADSLQLAENHRFLHADLDKVSRHSFAITVEDETSAPWYLPGDELIFDANRQPKAGDFVIAQKDSGPLYLGRYRPIWTAAGEDRGFEILPLNPQEKSASTAVMPGLALRGTLVEQRRYILHK